MIKINCPYCEKEFEISQENATETNLTCPYCEHSFINWHRTTKDVTCSNCKVELTLPKELENDEVLYCPVCKSNYKNPFYKKDIKEVNPKNQTSSNANKRGKWKLISAIIFTIIIVTFIVLIVRPRKYNDRRILWHTKSGYYFAISKTAYEKMCYFQQKNDSNSLRKLLTTGQIVILKAGTLVYLNYFEVGTVEVRIADNEYIHYWASGAAIEEDNP